MTFLFDSGALLLATVRDILPILALIIFFQLSVLRQPIPHLRRLIIGGVYVVIGLAMFLIGLEKALFPVGKAMAAQAGLGLDQASKDQEFGVQQMQADSQLRQQENQNKAQRAGNESEARMQKGALDSRRTVFDTSMNFDYAALQKRRQMQLKQSLLNSVARDF